MGSRWWYGVAASGCFWGVFVLVPDFFETAERLADPTVGTGLSLALVTSWLVLPAALYLDWRAIRDEVVWEPSVILWVLTAIIWFVNVSVTIAYVVRRRSALRETVPDERWRFVVGGTLLCWVVFFVLSYDAVAATLPPLVVRADGPVMFVAWVGLPAATYLDLAHVQGYTDWDPTEPLWLLGTGIPLLGFLVGLLYLGYRQRAIDRAEDPTTLSLDDATGPDAADADRGDAAGADRAGRVEGPHADAADRDAGPGDAADEADAAASDASDDAGLWDDVAPEESAGDEPSSGETTDEESDEDGQWDDVFEGR